MFINERTGENYCRKRDDKNTAQFSHIKPNTVVTAAKIAPKPKHKENTVGEIIS